MNRDLGRMEIEKLIVHDIPSRRLNSNGPTPTLSEIESPLTQSGRNYIRDKVIATLTNNSLPVIFDQSADSSVPELVLDNLGNQTLDFVEISQRMASYLFDSQTGVNTPGLLAVVQTTVESVRSIALVKLEREAGARVSEIQFQGKRTLDVQHITDLMLTDKTRVFKVGFFIQEGDTMESIEGLVSDNQSSRMRRGEVADFFLRKFLGCRFREDPNVTTRNFLNATEDWINEEVSDPLSKTKYEIFTFAEMERSSDVVRPRMFAEQYLALEDRQAYVNFLTERDVPTTEFLKDTSILR